MRHPPFWRLFAAALGLAFLAANPAAVLAHGLAHHDELETHHHLGSLDAHDGPAELAAPDYVGGHQHAQVDQATRATTHLAIPFPAVAVASPDLDSGADTLAAPADVTLIAAPDPPSNDPPRLRAPPLH